MEEIRERVMRTPKTLEKRYGKERKMRRVPVTLSNGKAIKYLPGSQNVLVKKVLADFCALYAPAGRVLYVSGTEKWSYLDPDALAELGLTVEEYGKMPDIVVHYPEKNRLFLIEAVGSHGPISPERRQELKDLFASSKVWLVFVTAFMDRRTMIKYLDDISWDTEVWIAEYPTHLTHLNGERFLGPYED